MLKLIVQGECIYTKLESGDTVVVFDIKWLFDVINKLNKEYLKELKHDTISNMYYFSSTLFKDLKFIQELAKLNLFDPQQIDFLFEILRNFNLVQKVENEKENFDRYVFGVPLLIENDTDKSLESIWPKKIENCFAGLFKI